MKSNNYYHKLDTDCLEFIIRDCNAAISANPENGKIYEYLKERTFCREILRKRETIRHLRKQLKCNVFDKLLHPIKKRWTIRNSIYDRSQFNNACWLYASYIKHDLV